MTFLQAVNQLLRRTGIIGGTGDDLAAFGGTRHQGSEELAKLAIQDELRHIAVALSLPNERVFATDITLAAGTRQYTLASGFVRFQDENPWFYKLDASDLPSETVIVPYRGGEAGLRKDYPRYRTTNGNPFCWYPSGTANNTIGFFQIPQAAHNGDKYGYYYEKSVTVALAADTLPFTLAEAANALVEAAARRFYYSPNAAVRNPPQLHPGGPDYDPVIRAARADVAALVNPRKPPSRYADRIIV